VLGARVGGGGVGDSQGRPLGGGVGRISLLCLETFYLSCVCSPVFFGGRTLYQKTCFKICPEPVEAAEYRCYEHY